MLSWAIVVIHLLILLSVGSMSKFISKKVALVTGSTDGIGLHTALKLALNEYKVCLHGRNPARLEQAREQIMKKAPQADVDVFLHDFIDLEGPRNLANEIISKYDRLDVLVNNAGVFQQNRVITKDNLESTFAINCCSIFILNLLLLPLLKRTDKSRILNVSSISQADIGTLDMSNLQFEKGDFTSYNSYSLSKLVVAMISHELALRIKPSDCLILSCDPGTVNTKMLLGKKLSSIRCLILIYSFHSIAGWGRCGIEIKDANDEYHLVTKAFDSNDHGKYFVHTRVSSCSKDVYNDAKRTALWQELERICNVKLEL